MIRIKRFVCNMLQENCYVISSDETLECVVIDCGVYFEEERKSLVKYIRDNHLTPTHVLCTHGHIDHNFGNNTMYEEFGITPEVHPGDRAIMEKLPQQAIQFIGQAPRYAFPPINHFLADGDEIKLGQHLFRVIHTPGHSMGSVCFYIKEENLLFTGDTLFRQSIGRTDLEGGSMMQIIQSLRLLAQMPDETYILPGHGESTTMGDELRMNPFLDR